MFSYWQTGRTLKYFIKIFCPSAASVDWESEKFTSLDCMREALLLDFKDHITNNSFQMGYFEPGHSFKGKQLPLTSDNELSEMYFEHHKRKSIRLWVKEAQTRQTKRPRSDTSDEATPAKKRSSVYDSHLEKMDKVEQILDKLKSKHENNKWTIEQLHCWANMIQMNRHHSYDVPPNKPFFGKQPPTHSAASSPGKRIQLRTQCIDQLTKWHKLLENEVIS